MFFMSVYRQNCSHFTYITNTKADILVGLIIFIDIIHKDDLNAVPSTQII